MIIFKCVNKFEFIIYLITLERLVIELKEKIEFRSDRN